MITIGSIFVLLKINKKRKKLKKITKESASAANELVNLIFDSQKNNIFKIQKKGDEEKIKNQLEKFKKTLKKSGFKTSGYSEKEITKLAHKITTNIAREEIKKGLY